MSSAREKIEKLTYENYFSAKQHPDCLALLDGSNRCLADEIKWFVSALRSIANNKLPLSFLKAEYQEIKRQDRDLDRAEGWNFGPECKDKKLEIIFDADGFIGLAPRKAEKSWFGSVDEQKELLRRRLF